MKHKDLLTCLIECIFSIVPFMVFSIIGFRVHTNLNKFFKIHYSITTIFYIKYILLIILCLMSTGIFTPFSYIYVYILIYKVLWCYT